MSHQEALSELEAGRPLAALHLWGQLLRADHATCLRHLEALAASLSGDPLEQQHRLGLQLAQALLSCEPTHHEVDLLGALLRSWGTLCSAEAPERALQHLERAWCCSRDEALDGQLAALYHRLGLHDGAWALQAESAEEPGPDPWPSPCAAQGCLPCQERLAQGHPITGSDGQPGLHELMGGEAWIQHRTNPWGHTHGLAVSSADGLIQLSLTRSYPWPWPHCPHRITHQQRAASQLGHLRSQQEPPLRWPKPVLAVVDLSAELYYHWMLETLPRLGIAWQALQPRLPGLTIWHNGGAAPWVAESLARLGAPEEALLDAHEHPCIQAPQLLVPAHTPFGAPSARHIAWLRRFWQIDDAEPNSRPSPKRIYLRRGVGAQRRPVLGEGQLLDALPQLGWHSPYPNQPVKDQLQAIAAARELIAPHGAALANLIAARPDAELLEWCNPSYTPPYFQRLSACTAVRHRYGQARGTPEPFQEWLYAGPLAFPIDPGEDPSTLITRAVAPC